MIFKKLADYDYPFTDFDKNDLEKLVKDYYGRNRRFGKL